MKTAITLLLVLTLTACVSSSDAKKLVQSDRYQDEYFNICLASSKMSKYGADTRAALCLDFAESALQIARAAYKREGLSEAHNDKCKALFKAEPKAELCFKSLQHGYYKRVAKSAYALFPK